MTDAAKTPPATAGVVVIGGGVIGCSIAYHLTKISITDVVLLERRKLTSGTTWHAAGLIGQLRGSANMTRLAKYTAELYRELEGETGQATGLKQNGSISVALHEGRMEEFRRNASMAKVFGLQVDIITPEEVRERHPLVETGDVLGGTWIPSDGQGNPADITLALAKGARMGGARLFEDTKVTGIIVENGRAAGVRTAAGEVRARWVVLATGMWGRDMAAKVGVTLPLHACEHFYIVTEPFDGMTPDLPVLRVYDECAYYKEDAGKMLIGAFEPKAKPWGMDGIPDDFEFDQLPDDFDHFEPILEAAMARLPALENAGIQTFFNGPESFTPDVRYNLGPAPGLDGLMVAAGLNSIGIQSAGGIGRVVADWIKSGHAPMDLWEVDVRRQMPFQANRAYLRDRVSESLGLLYATHWPFQQYTTGRGLRRSPLHEQLKAANACFGESAGWERANWFAPEGTEPKYEYSYGRQNWFDHSAAEHRAAREGVALFDLTTFAKFRVEGADAAPVLGRVSANHVAGDAGRAVYTQWLNDRGGIEADLTVTRLAEDAFLVVTSGACQVRDFHWLKGHVQDHERCTVTDVTSGHAVIGIAGPKSRDLLAVLTPENLANDAFPFGASREVEFAMAMARMTRISYAGELGWEIMVPTEFAAHAYEAVVAAGRDFGMVHAGMHAMNSLRIEKAYRHWGHDISDEDTVLEAGLGFAVAWDKPGGFIGREALLTQREAGITRRLLQFLVTDPEPLLYHNEPIWRDGAIVGKVTSGMYGHTLGGAVGMGYVAVPDGGVAGIDGHAYEIEIAGVRYPARASLKPLYDPASSRLRG
ncbi:MAG: FAD-dependent oxidoreductase [Magnetovibrio sp.]|nr:FAD-dependent oxidoreductase [Magnetovibrio sp.]